MRKLPGTQAEKTAWLEENLPLMGLEVLKDPNLKTDARRSHALGAVAIRYYRAELKRATETPKTQAALKPGYETAADRLQRETGEWMKNLKGNP